MSQETITQQQNSMYQSGDSIPSKRFLAYIIEQELGSGATSQVYLAHIDGQEQKVALKVLRPYLHPSLEANFFLEARILDDLRAAEKADEGFTGIFSTPERYETRSRESGVEPPYYLAQELVRGISLEDILTKTPYYLPNEDDAIIIASQVAHVLHLLHTRLNRSYTDFQLKNIYWHAETQSVMVIDWNHVSEPGKGNVQEDLLRLGAHFYRMLTGKLAATGDLPQSQKVSTSYLHGEPVRYLERRAAERWEAVSLGARNIVIKALHPNVQSRFPDAQSFWDALGTLARLRKTDTNTLVGKIMGNAQSVDSDIVMNAEEMLDLIQRRGGFGSDLRAQEDMLRQSLAESAGMQKRPWQAGLNDYKGRNYTTALERWLNLATTTARLEYYRWAHVTYTAKLNPAVCEQVRERIEQSVELLEAEKGLASLMTGKKYSEQIDYVQRSHEQLRPVCSELAQLNKQMFDPIDAILAEIEARLYVRESRQYELAGELEKAAECLENADAALNRIKSEYPD